MIQDLLPEYAVHIHTFFTQEFVGIRFLMSLRLLGMTANKGCRLQITDYRLQITDYRLQKENKH
ncbi:hypothetical protein VspSTUT11_26250 [Vibrio sp. STUT-A11]|nr:hypothetical protein VspSTUT11_26250 [Vibrio sp. STUT-A11]